MSDSFSNFQKALENLSTATEYVEHKDEKFVQEPIRPYNKEEFRSQFEKTETYSLLSKDYNTLLFEKNFPPWFHASHVGQTPRLMYIKHITSVFSVVPFYYINFLFQENNPKNVYDLGCGQNLFKKYIPNLIGIGAEDPADPYYSADIHDFVDDQFVARHQNYFDAVFSINALHFVALDDLRKVVLDFASMIRSTGKGFLALNLQRMIERASRHLYNQNLSYIENWVHQQLSNMPFDYEVYDVDFTCRDDFMDGNIRLVIRNVNLNFFKERSKR